MGELLRLDEGSLVLESDGHRRITTWLAEEKHTVHVKEAVGHADQQTTMKYTHLAKEHLRSLVDDSPNRQRESLGT